MEVWKTGSMEVNFITKTYAFSVRR